MNASESTPPFCHHKTLMVRCRPTPKACKWSWSAKWLFLGARASCPLEQSRAFGGLFIHGPAARAGKMPALPGKAPHPAPVRDETSLDSSRRRHPCSRTGLGRRPDRRFRNTTAIHRLEPAPGNPDLPLACEDLCETSLKLSKQNDTLAEDREYIPARPPEPAPTRKVNCPWVTSCGKQDVRQLQSPTLRATRGRCGAPSADGTRGQR